MTKAELAAIRRISPASADRLIRRQGWRRMPGNDGSVRALVPSDWLEPRHADPTDAAGTAPSDESAGPTDKNRTINALETAITALSEQLTRERERAEAAEVERDQVREDADRRIEAAEIAQAQAEADATQLRDDLAAAEARADAAARGAEQAEQRAREARTEADLQRDHADEAEGEASVQRERVETAERQAQDAREEHRKAAAEVARLREADAARRMRGLVARLRAAWRGE